MSSVISPHRLFGTVSLPPSDGEVCRFLACAAFSETPCSLKIPGLGADSTQMVSALRALGAKIKEEDGIFSVTPIWDTLPDQPSLDFGTSRTALRLLLPTVCWLRSGVCFSGISSDPPAEILMRVFSEHGCSVDQDRYPFYIDGLPDDGIYTIPGDTDEDSLFGLALMLSLRPDRGQISWNGMPDERSLSVLRVLNLFGAATEETFKGLFFPAGKLDPSAPCLCPRGDSSSALLFLAAGAASGPISVSGADPADPQIRVFSDLLEKGGISVVEDGDQISAYRGETVCFAPEYTEIATELLPALTLLFSAYRHSCVLYARDWNDPEFGATCRRLSNAFRPLGVCLTEDDGKAELIFAPSASTGSASDPLSLAAAVLAAASASDPVIFSDLSPLTERFRMFRDTFTALGGLWTSGDRVE